MSADLGLAKLPIHSRPRRCVRAYESAFNETESLGASASTTRTADQTDTAEPPPNFASRNMLLFASHQSTLGDAARVMAMVWVAQADGNANTASDAAWTPVVPTPNHPKYPAAHACFAGAGAVAEAVRVFYGTRQVSFTFDSRAAGVVHTRHT